MRLAVLLFCSAWVFGQSATTPLPLPKVESPAGPPSQYFDLGMGTDGRQLGALDILTDNHGVDFGPYLQRVVQNVRENWNRIASGSASLRLKLQSKKERIAIEFAVTKQGKVQDTRFATFPVDSEFAYLTRGSVADAFPPLPNDFNGPYLRLRFRVYYNPDKSDELGINGDGLIISGNEARMRGDYKLSISLLNRAVEANPKSKSAWNDLGVAYYDSREDEKAIQAFEKQVEIDPLHQFSYNLLGRVYLRQRKYEEAEKWFRKQIEVDPLTNFAHLNLGVMFLESHRYEDAVPELTKAVSLMPNYADTQVRLGEVYLNLGQDEKAMAAFDKAVQISATPMVWNSIAYQLSLKRAHLDLARHYADSAITTITASLQNISLDYLSQRDLNSTLLLANYWDTMGWVEFGDGNFNKALKYLKAAWQLNQPAVFADHLGQVYSRQDENEKAKYYYALSLNTGRSLPETRKRLADLLGGDEKVNGFVESYRGELDKLRMIPLNNFKYDGTGTADFLLVLDITRWTTRVREVKFVNGDEKLKPAADALRAAKYEQSIPDETPVLLLRGGTVDCKSGAQCTFSLALPEDVRTVADVDDNPPTLPALATTPDGVFHVGGGITPPRAVYSPEPEYTEKARKSNLQGSCTLGLIVEEDGHPSHIRVLKSIGMGLDENAVAAVQKWKFEPATKDGHPVRVEIAIKVDFHLYGKPANSH